MAVIHYCCASYDPRFPDMLGCAAYTYSIPPLPLLSDLEYYNDDILLEILLEEKKIVKYKKQQFNAIILSAESEKKKERQKTRKIK